MAQKGLTRGQAEKRYGEFLADPDGFALAAAEEQRREKGEWNWQKIFLYIYIKCPEECMLEFYLRTFNSCMYSIYLCSSLHYRLQRLDRAGHGEL